MMIDPPIDKLVAKAGCKYALVCVLSKRARYLMDKKRDMLVADNINPVSYAAKEIYNGVVDVKKED